jgi:hypothetical protein
MALLEKKEGGRAQWADAIGAAGRVWVRAQWADAIEALMGVTGRARWAAPSRQLWGKGTCPMG